MTEGLRLVKALTLHFATRPIAISPSVSLNTELYHVMDEDMEIDLTYDDIKHDFELP